MNQKIDVQIEKYEKRLKQAMLKSDIFELDKLLSKNLVFTNHLGMLMSKQDDIKMHESGMLTISEINISDQKVTVYDDVAIVSVKTRILGNFGGKESDSDFRFTRVWKKNIDNCWQVIAGHSSIII